MSVELIWPLLLGLIVGFYWGRVIKLVRKTRLATGKSAHLFPPELLGKIIRFVWYPTVVLWIVVPLFTGLGVLDSSLGRLFTPVFTSLPVHAIATLVAGAALYFTMICWRRMGRDWRMGIDPNEQNNLIVTGPYAYVRHPIYALSQLLMLASVVTLPTPLMIVVGVIHIAFLNWESIREERHLTHVHGRAYTDYMRSTGRFLPPLRRSA